MSGPLSQYAEHLRHVATMLERFQPEPMPMPIIWHDFHLGFDSSDDDEETRGKMRRQFFALMNKANITDKDVQLAVVQEILGPYTTRTEPIRSRADLTVSEFGRVIQALKDWEAIEGYAS